MWREPLKWAILPGLALLALSIQMTLIGPADHGNLPEGFRSPILAFEFMQTHKQVVQFFEVPDPLAYRDNIFLFHQWDIPFLIIYPLFLTMVAWGSKRQGNMLAYAAWILCPLMGIADLFENFTMNSIALHHALTDTTGLLQWLNLFTWLKWCSIAAMLLCFVPWLWQRQGVVGAITAGVVAATFGLAIVSYISPSGISELFALGVSLSFLGLFIVCLAFRRPRAE
jgi:hypothetical protein